MTDLVSQFLSGSPSYRQGGIPPSRVFSIRPSQDPNLTVIYLDGTPPNGPPLYSVANVRGAKPDLLLFWGPNHPNNIIGDANFSSMSSKADLSLRGRPLRMKMSQMSGDFKVECPPMGAFKWKVNKLTGSLLEMYDGSGHKLAQFKKSGSFFGASEKRLEILVPCDDFLVELIILSGTAAKAMTKSVNETAAEIVGAVAGA